MEFKKERNKILLMNENISIGEIDFSYLDEKNISIDHTYVNSNYRGQGIASKLILEVIQFVKENSLRIKPTCSYAVSFFQKHNEYKIFLMD
ncbi:MAG TPA: N-acetyltransferase [Firmicutes bacterium]|nr:N-acetyltransferase [Bacillota bacterium]